MRQGDPPDEIIVSDAAGDAETRDLVRGYGVRHCRTTRRALPWQRWWAFEHALGSIVMFIDDDIRLTPDAIARLRAAYRDHPDAAGIGFPITYEQAEKSPVVYDICDGAPLDDAPATPPPTLRERWLGTAGKTRGSITRGGQTVDLPAALAPPVPPVPPEASESCESSEPSESCESSVPVGPSTDEPGGGIVEVDWLSGGAMSFRRDVLKAIGPLHHLFALYDARIGKAEDAILSSRARRHGRLLLIVEPCARHPAFERATRTANPQDGYHKGLLETWGRAHVLRWLASDPQAASRAWMRLATLEIARASKAALRRPASAAPWQRLIGGAVGIQRTIRRWREIPSPTERPPRRDEPATHVMFFWDYDTQWGADRSRMQRGRDWGYLEFPGTDELLDLHARFGVPACFAVVGAAALPGERPYHDPKQIQRIHAAGHEIASHAFKHEWLPGLNRRALLRTLRDSKDALEQCIGAPVVSFVPPFNQPFHYVRGWSFSVSELREAGVHHITLDRLCDALRETGYRFCRVAYAPLTERAAEVADMLRGHGRAHGSEVAFRPGPPVTIAGITCVRVGPCGFGTARVSELYRRASRRERHARVVALYGHPHSIRSGDINQSIDALKPTMAMVGEWMREGTVRCVRPSELVAS
jgi:GT2 family glycosyltransferase